MSILNLTASGDVIIQLRSFGEDSTDATSLSRIKLYENTVNDFATSTYIGDIVQGTYLRSVQNVDIGSTLYFWITNDPYYFAESSETSLGSISITRKTPTVYRQDSTPSSPITGDIWFDTDDDNKVYIYNGSTWDLSDSQIVASRIISGSIGAETIELDGASSILQSSNYVSNTSGWRILGDGNAEFNDIQARGNLGVDGANGSLFPSGSTSGNHPDKPFNGGVGQHTLQNVEENMSTSNTQWAICEQTYYGSTSTSGSANINNRINGQKHLMLTASVNPIWVTSGHYMSYYAKVQYKKDAGAWTDLVNMSSSSLGTAKPGRVSDSADNCYPIHLHWSGQMGWVTDFTSTYYFRILVSKSGFSSTSASNEFALGGKLSTYIVNI